MKMRSLWSLLMLFVTLVACGQAAGHDNGLLWKISGNGLEQPSYLFGTHHLVPLTFLETIDGLDEAFEATEQVVGELDMNDMNALQMQVMQASVMDPQYQYADLLSEADYELLDSKLKELLMGMGLDQLGQMKPAMLNNMIAVTLYQQFYPEMNAQVSIDQHFQQKAMRRLRPVVGLEEIEDQIYALLGHQTIERQAESLACMLNHPELLKEQMDRMTTAYLAHELSELDAMYKEEREDDPCPSTQEEKDILNKDRNERWLKKLPEIMADKSSFIAVGCLRLVGEDGLIIGLQQQGYTVEVVK